MNIPSPDTARRIERLLGRSVERFEPVHGGYTPTHRFRCFTATGTVFAKIGSTPYSCACVSREISIYQRVTGSFMPRLIDCEDGTIPILLIEDLSHATWPPPWTMAHVESVLEQIAEMNRTHAPIEPFAVANAEWGKPGWQQVAEDPEPFLSLGHVDSTWLERHLTALLDMESHCSTEGNALCHWDLRSDNLCFVNNRAVIIDWNIACLSNPKLDLGFWLPSLAYEGGPLPESILPDAPEVAAWVSGFFAARAGLPIIPDAPRVRLVQQQQLETALPWAMRALGIGDQ
jgi:hypothetical protein